MISLRNISCASAVVSVLSLERSMLGTFGKNSVRFTLSMEAWSGGLAFLILFVMGIGIVSQLTDSAMFAPSFGYR